MPEFQSEFLPGYLGTPGCILFMSDSSNPYNILPGALFLRPDWMLLGFLYHQDMALLTELLTLHNNSSADRMELVWERVDSCHF